MKKILILIAVVIVVVLLGFVFIPKTETPPETSSHATADPLSWPQDPTGKYALVMIDMDNQGNEWSIQIRKKSDLNDQGFSVVLESFYPKLKGAFPKFDESVLDRMGVLSLFPQNIGPWSKDGRYLWGLVVDVNNNPIAHYRINPENKLIEIIK